MDIREIKAEINRLENNETTYSNCSKLAVLYCVKDHLDDDTPEMKIAGAYSYDQSEFLSAVSKAPIDQVLDILDEHMEAVQILHPKEYASVIRRIKEISPR